MLILYPLGRSFSPLKVLTLYWLYTFGEKNASLSSSSFCFCVFTEFVFYPPPDFLFPIKIYLTKWKSNRNLWVNHVQDIFFDIISIFSLISFVCVSATFDLFVIQWTEKAFGVEKVSFKIHNKKWIEKMHLRKAGEPTDRSVITKTMAQMLVYLICSTIIVNCGN